MEKYILSHEHLSIKLNKEGINYENDNLVINELNRCFEKGLSEFVDLSNESIGQNFDFIKKIIQCTQVKIHYSIGLYKSPYIDHLSDKRIIEIYYLLKELLKKGLFNIGYLPSTIGEVGASLMKITDVEKKAIIACTLLAKEYNLPLVIHTTYGTCAYEIFKMIKPYKIKNDKLMFSHMDLCKNKSNLMTLLSLGVYVGFDTFGKIDYMTDKQRINNLIYLIKKGYDKQICISTDITKKSFLEQYGYDYLINHIKPMLINYGIENEIINNLIYYNSRRLLYGK